MRYNAGSGLPPYDVTTGPGTSRPVVLPTDPDFWDPRAFLPTLSVRLKGGGERPFIMKDRYAHQILMALVLIRAYREDKWIAVLKARQLGSSTFWAAIGYQNMTWRMSVEGAIITHKESVTKALSEAVVRYYQSTPKSIRPRRTKGLKRQLEIRRTIDGEDKITGKMEILTARGEDPGRGLTLNFVLASEISSWKENLAAKAWASIRNAVPSQGGLLIAESTPKRDGDPMHEVWIESQAAGSKFLPLFIPWTMVAEYRARPPVGWSPNMQVQQYADEHHLDIEQAFWLQTEGLSKCAGDMAIFRSEYPVNDLECWLTAGGTTFDKAALMAQLDRIDGHTHLAGAQRELEIYAHPVAGSDEVLRQHQPLFTSGEGAQLPAAEEIEPEHEYAIIVDTASSFARRDYWAIFVGDLHECEQVAEFQGHSDANRCARLVAELSELYNEATVYIERNSIGEALIVALQSLGFTRIYYSRPAYSGRPVPGWHSSAKSKSEAIVCLQRLLSDGSLTLWSRRLVRQLLSYTSQWDRLARDEQGGHYDLVIVTCIFAWVYLRHTRRVHARQRNISVNERWRRMLRHAGSGRMQASNTPWGDHT